MAKVLLVIPARAGSKGVKGKNKRLLLGKPLIHWAAEAAMQSRLCDTKICSTDSNELKECVQKTGIQVPWLRPSELAQDHSLTVDVLIHALKQYQKKGECFDYVALVQPTSPTVLGSDIDLAIETAIKQQADTVISGYVADHAHPSLMYRHNQQGEVEWLLPKQQRKQRRQEFDTVFIRTGLVYVIAADTLLQQQTIYGDKVVAIEIPKQRCLSIDDEFDFEIAEFLLQKQLHLGQ